MSNPKSAVPQSKLSGKLLIETAMGSFLGDKRIRLLEAIDKTGSISQAAKAVRCLTKRLGTRWMT